MGTLQLERFFAELRSYELGNSAWSLLSLLNIVRRWHYMQTLLTDPGVNLPLPPFVPVVCLGCAVRVIVQTPAGCATAGVYEADECMPTRGGPRLEPQRLHARMFAASAMVGDGDAPLECMLLPSLKAELKARGEGRGGTKHVMQRRLHGLLVQAAITRRKRPRSRAQEEWAQIFGSSDDDYPSSSD